ncbi:MAG: polysaccharide deacetylase family protein [Fimbriimonadaceae bacterium]|nr:polysaccharide deacetylase family protein [Fimbriimonadaceae bacterium]
MKRTRPRSSVAWLAVVSAMVVAMGCVTPQFARRAERHPGGDSQTARRVAPKRGVNPASMQKTDPYWQRALQEVYRSTEELVGQDAREKRRGQALPKISRGNPREKILALTFDDGPHPVLTERLLAILKQADVKATFFVVGKMVKQHPRLLDAIDKAGMEVGNHTYSHVTLTKIPELDIETEYRANNDLVRALIGKEMRYCRPPGGDYDATVVRAATKVGLLTVLWTDDPGDYASPGDNAIERKTLARLSNGGIVLLHDGIRQTLDVLPQVLRYAKARGFRFVTMSDLERSLTGKAGRGGIAK